MSSTPGFTPPAVVHHEAASGATPEAHKAAPLLTPAPEAAASGSVEDAASPKTSVTLMTAGTSKAIDEAIAHWFQTEVHGSEISQYTPAYNKLRAILPKLAASLKGII